MIRLTITLLATICTGSTLLWPTALVTAGKPEPTKNTIEPAKPVKQPPASQDGVIPVDDTPTVGANRQLEAKIDQLLAIAQANNQLNQSIAQSVDGLQDANRSNAMLIVDAIQTLKPEPKPEPAPEIQQEPAKAKEAPTVLQSVLRTETRYRLETRTVCNNGVCQQQTVRVPYQVQVRDVVPVDPTQPDQPVVDQPIDDGNGCPSDCGCGCQQSMAGMSQQQASRRVPVFRRLISWLGRLRANRVQRRGNLLQMRWFGR